MNTELIVESFKRSARPVILADFDGTLSDIVSDPAHAAPVPGAVDALSALAASGCRTVVISGRPLAFLLSALEGIDPAVQLVGHSGFETQVDGTVEVDESVAPWVPVVRQTAELAAASRPDGVHLEDKGLSFVLHFRQVPEREPAVTEMAARLAADSGLSMKPGRMSVELRPPVAVDKGTAVRNCLEQEMDWALFAGDDVVDLPAFEALRQADLQAICVAVGSAELPPELAAEADLELASPDALVKLLTLLGPD